MILPHHQKLLDDSAISSEVAAARGYRSVTDPAELERLGFALEQCLVPTLLVPRRTVYGTDGPPQHRPDQPRKIKGKIVKYETPKGSRTILDVPAGAQPALRDPSKPLGITEGSRKADSAVSRGHCCVSVAGVWNWKGKNEKGGLTTLADWDSVALNQRFVYLAFDSDVTGKPSVGKALERFRRFLENKTAVVFVLRVPPGPNGQKQGLDDYLAGGGSLDVLIAAAQAESDFEPMKKLDPTAATEMWAAQQFAAENRDRFAWCQDLKTWLVYRSALTPSGLGGVWVEDVGGIEVLTHVKLMVTGWGARAAEYREADRKKLWNYAIKCSDIYKQQAIMESAKTTLAVRLKRFDADQWVLSCANGLLDLRTFTIRSARPEDYCLGQADAEYLPGYTDAHFERLLHENLPDDETRQTAQEVAGYSLTGDKWLEIMDAMFGPKRSGKTTFTDLWRKTLGTYATHVPAEIFMVSPRGHDGESNRPTTATVIGKRLVTSAEGSHRHKLDVNTVLAMTGRDPMTATPKYGRPIKFDPEFLWVLHGNTRPQVDHEEDAMRSRLVEIPFKVGHEEEQVDSALKSYLLTSQSARNAFLAWAVEGLKRLTARPGQKLFRGSEVRASTAEFWEAQDTFRTFLQMLDFSDPKAYVRATDLDSEFVEWAQDESGVDVKTALPKVKQLLKARGCQRLKPRINGEQVRIWTGVRLVGPAGPAGTGTAETFSRDSLVRKVPASAVPPGTGGPSPEWMVRAKARAQEIRERQAKRNPRR